MSETLENYCEQEGISKDDIINSEIEQEHKEAAERTPELIYKENRGQTTVYAVDKPAINNNAYHEFVIMYEPENVPATVLEKIKLQNGNFAEFGHNGIFTEHLLIIAKDCLERFNTSKYACRENSIAITKIEEALMWIDKRMAKRVERGVYGTETV